MWLVSILPRSNIGEYQWFEDMPYLPKKYLNHHEKGLKINKEYILQFWEDMQTNFANEKWEWRVDRPETKVWNSVNGSRFDK